SAEVAGAVIEGAKLTFNVLQ
nr:RecName: Full=DELTA-actitoxin-Afr1b; Short=DELTA-AITX-Afr1b; AltName: Full=Alpha-helical pore-forming toxin; Short=PFT; AltName: Full=Cytolysin; AltName: Full=Fragaceatoxin A; Short=fraA [Actinia fragacea]